MLVVLKSLLLDFKLCEDRDCIFFVPTVYQSITVNKCLLNKNELTVKCQIWLCFGNTEIRHVTHPQGLLSRVKEIDIKMAMRVAKV